ncbi:MAG: hypothetical protein NC337_09330 [Roseburia sp.]|nr:hypothetical protein [Roseburia sp.]
MIPENIRNRDMIGKKVRTAGALKNGEEISEYQKALKWLAGYCWDSDPTADEPLATICEALQEMENCKDRQTINVPCRVGDKVYADSGTLGILEYEVDRIVIDKNIVFQCSSYSQPVGDCPGECLDEIEPDISDFGETVFLTKKEAETALRKKKSGLFP